MNPKHGLPEETIAQIVTTLAEFPQVEKAVLFGSRAKGTHKRGSDIDLALIGTTLDWLTAGRIDGALDDLPVPYRFSVIVLNERTDSAVAAHIQRVGIPLFQRQTTAEVK